MRKILGITLIIVLFGVCCIYCNSGDDDDDNNDNNDNNTTEYVTPRILIVLPHKYGANFYLNLTNFQRFGWGTTITAVTDPVQACNWAAPLGVPDLSPDLLISEVTDIQDYDVLAIMTATLYQPEPYQDLLNSTEMMDLIRSAVNNNVVVYAACGGVRVLAAAGVLNNVSVTGHPQFQSEYEAAGANYLGTNIPPVIDGFIVTGVRGMYYNVQNCDAIAKALDLISDQQ